VATTDSLRPTCVLPSRAPAIELIEEADALFVCCEVAGTKPEEIRLDVGDTFVVIRIDRPATFPLPPDESASYAEFERAVSLPCEIRPGDAQARLRNGVLELVLPKKDVGGTGVFVLPPK
jgi:HSP20 family protein